MSKITCVAPKPVSIVTKKPRRVVLPVPTGPIAQTWPTSLRLPPSAARGSLACSEKWNGDRALVTSIVSASPQWLPLARPAG